ncbi:Hsp70 family protein [Frankia sp. AvcI1]|uniref:Hsp70 family protein n=1 Tax=Frankia sp. AvcI1 TaxID=573496 RepID=UPI002118F775|nr:Hsp70 family protein [Frankia sp. AvcI1]
MTYGLGIDLGTTFTAVAIGWPDRREMVSLGNRSIVAPTVVYAGRDGHLLTGDAADRRALREPDRAAREFKRRLGDPTPVLLGDAPYSPAALLAAVLRDAVGSAIRLQGGPPQQIVLTRPAVWGPYRMEQFDEVPRLAGLVDVTLVTEPVAAATYYATGRRLSDGDVIAVYDLGGGTFDAAVLRMEAGQARILGNPEGIEWLGGADFDEAILHHVDRELDGAVTAADPRDRDSAVALSRLRQECVLAKEALSADEDTVIPVLLPGIRQDVKLGRAQFEEMIRPAIESTVEALHRALSSAEVRPDDLSAVLLAGGSSRIPLVARMIEAATGRPTVVDAHPKHVVALGAAGVAALLAPAALPPPAPPGPTTPVPAGQASPAAAALPLVADSGNHGQGAASPPVGAVSAVDQDGTPPAGTAPGTDTGEPAAGADDGTGPPAGPGVQDGENQDGQGRLRSRGRGRNKEREERGKDGDKTADPARRARARRRRQILIGSVGILVALAVGGTAVALGVDNSDSPSLASSAAVPLTPQRTAAPTGPPTGPATSEAIDLTSGTAATSDPPTPAATSAPAGVPPAAVTPAGQASRLPANPARPAPAPSAAAPKVAPAAAPAPAPAAAPAPAPAPRVTAVPAPGPQTSWTFVNVSTSLCLDSDASGAAYTKGCNGGDYQRWKLVQASGGYQLKDLATGLCEGARSNIGSDGTKYQGSVYTAACASQASLTWSFATNSFGYQFTNVATGECLDSNGQGRAYTQDCNGGNFQHWSRN